MGTDRIKAQRQRNLGRRAHRGRSDLYRHIRNSHPDLVQQKVGTRDGPSWEDVAAQLASEGALDRKGQPPSGETVRKMFKRVSRDVAAETAFQVTGVRPGTPHRVQAPPDWKPTPVTAARVLPPARHAPPNGLNDTQAPSSRMGPPGAGYATQSAEQAAEAISADSRATPDLPRHGGPLTLEQVRAMKADLQRTLDERSGR